MTRDEKDVVWSLIEYLRIPLPPDDDLMDMFWWDYGWDQISQDLPWKEDPDRANYLMTVAMRYHRIWDRRCAMTCS